MTRSTPDAPRGQPTTSVRLEPVARHDRTVPWIGAFVAAFLLLAIAKPWSAPVPAASPVTTRPVPASALASRPPAPAVSTASVASPAPTASTLESADDACFTSLWWATFVEGSQGHELRTWYRVEPVQATGALDKAIPTVRLFASAPWALGFCVGQLDSGRRVGAVQAWRLDARARTAQEVGLERISGESPIDCDRGGLFAGPRDAPHAEGIGAPAVWPPGRYVFRVGFGEPEGSSEWFAIDIVRVHEASLEVGLDGSGTPGASARPSGTSGASASPGAIASPRASLPPNGTLSRSAAASAPGHAGLSRASMRNGPGR